MPSKARLTEKKEWQALIEHRNAISNQKITTLFEQDENRFENFSLKLDGLLFDYSKNNITEETISKLIDLTKSCDLEHWRDQMFSGAAINNSENRAVLHTALRGSVAKNISVDDENIANFVSNTLDQLKSISEHIRASNVTDIVHIGIGGSDLGPHMICEALKPFSNGPNVHFVSNIDGAHLSQTLKKLNPETTNFIVSSKTFSTLETLMNANSAKAWLGQDKTATHFFAITGNTDAAESFGIQQKNILPMRDWVGGRYSLWSAIGLIIAVAFGFEQFEKLLEGAHAADEHFKSAPLENNIPVIMALIGIWHRNFCNYSAHAILPYAQNLHRFPRYIQQLDMESNGKSVDRDGQFVEYKTSPVIFGEPGTNAQHAFLQLLHQGVDIVPCDFIIPIQAHHDLNGHHINLITNALAQSEALMTGSASKEEPHNHFDGNRPSSSFIINNLDAYHLGMLCALYEHKIFVQGVIWNLNSFDQWGVELGKKIAKKITQSFDSKEEIENLPDTSSALLKYIAGHNS